VKPVTGPKRTLFGTFFDVRNLMKVSERAGCGGATRHTPTTSRLRLRTDSGSAAQVPRKGGRQRELREGSSESGTNRRLRPTVPITRHRERLRLFAGVRPPGSNSSECEQRGARDRLDERGLLRTNASVFERSSDHRFGGGIIRVRNGAVG